MLEHNREKIHCRYTTPKYYKNHPPKCPIRPPSKRRRAPRGVTSRTDKIGIMGTVLPIQVGDC